MTSPPPQQDIRRILDQLVSTAFLQLIHAAGADQLNIKQLGPETNSFIDGDLGPLESMFWPALVLTDWRGMFLPRNIVILP